VYVTTLNHGGMLLMRVVVEEWGVCTAATQVGQKEQNE
jgi:hypothetical protein